MENNYNEISDSLLIKKLKSKNRELIDEGYEGIYYKYAKLAFLCIHQIVKNYQDSEDLTQDVFINIFNNRDRLIEEKNLKYYIVVSAKNAAITFITKKKLECEYNDNYIYEDVSDSDSHIQEIINIMRKYLDEEEIDIIIDHIIYGDSFKDIASKKGVSENTIKTKYYRAIDKVKYGEEDEE